MNYLEEGEEVEEAVIHSLPDTSPGSTFNRVFSPPRFLLLHLSLKQLFRVNTRPGEGWQALTLWWSLVAHSHSTCFLPPARWRRLPCVFLKGCYLYLSKTTHLFHGNSSLVAYEAFCTRVFNEGLFPLHFKMEGHSTPILFDFISVKHDICSEYVSPVGVAASSSDRLVLGSSSVFFVCLFIPSIVQIKNFQCHTFRHSHKSFQQHYQWAQHHLGLIPKQHLFANVKMKQ